MKFKLLKIVMDNRVNIYKLVRVTDHKNKYTVNSEIIAKNVTGL